MVCLVMQFYRNIFIKINKYSNKNNNSGTYVLFIVFIVILSNSNSNCYETQELGCKMIEDKSPRLQLKRHLFCDYDPAVRPTFDEKKNKTEISIIIIPKLADFDDVSHVLNLHSWMYITWKDAHLSWKPDDFNGVDTLWVPSDEIWTPDLAVLNAGDGNYQTGISYTNCILSPRGTVVCVPAVLYTLRCDADYKYWPFDQQSCNVEFASWAHNNNEISFNMVKFAIVMIHFYNNPEWKVTPGDVYFEQRKSRYTSYDESPTVVVNFKVERQYSALWKVFISPMFVMTIITLTTLWLDAGCKERLIVACVNFVFHLFCMQAIHIQTPTSGMTVPNIFVYYHNSLILASISLITTCLFRKLMEIKTIPPAWINSCLSVILSSKTGQILLLSVLDPKASAIFEEDGDDRSGLVNNSDNQLSRNFTWKYVIAVIGWFLLFSFLIVYIVMLAIYLHVPSQQI